MKKKIGKFPEPFYATDSSLDPDINHESWQKCPVCEGHGKRFVHNDTQGNYFKNCPTCKGKRIISTITGKPPKDD